MNNAERESHQYSSEQVRDQTSAGADKCRSKRVKEPTRKGANKSSYGQEQERTKTEINENGRTRGGAGNLSRTRAAAVGIRNHLNQVARQHNHLRA